MPNVSIVVVTTTSFCEASGLSMNMLRIIHQMDMSRRPSPTTVRPITAPERNAILSPELSERLTALAVLAEAKVAVFMPMNPASPEKKPPVRKAKGTQGFCTPKP